MRVLEQKAEIVLPLKSRKDLYASIVGAGRVCYASSEDTNEDGLAQFIRKLISKGHESVLEHEGFSFVFTTDRGILGELTRHRLASFSVESTRYCNYEDPASFKVISPFKGVSSADERYITWLGAMEAAETVYGKLLQKGVSLEIARGVLPLSFATKIRMTANIREWRHIFRLRLSKAAHPQIVELMGLALKEVSKLYPVFFEDISRG
jgi:thymidylate synthase (FAD)